MHQIITAVLGGWDAGEDEIESTFVQAPDQIGRRADFDCQVDMGGFFSRMD